LESEKEIGGGDELLFVQQAKKQQKKTNKIAFLLLEMNSGEEIAAINQEPLS
jgi:hypothetical protein